MEKQGKKIKASVVIYWTLVGIVCVLLVSVHPVMAAETVWDRFSTIVRDFYAQILAISTIVAVTVAAVALIVRMVSRNQKAVDEATAWLKRIVITWILLNSLGLIVAYIQPLIAGGNYTQPAPIRYSSGKFGVGNPRHPPLEEGILYLQ